MKNAFIVLIIILFGLEPVNARRNSLFGWFHLTPKFGVGTSLITNGEMFKQDNLTPGVVNLSYMFGGQLGVAFVDKFDVSFETNYNISGQRYGIELSDLGYDKNLKITCLDYALIFKYMGPTSYYEIGTSFSTVKDILYSNTVNKNPMAISPDFTDTYNQFISNYNNLILGFGATLAQVELFEITMGLRAKYSFQSILNKNMYLVNDSYYDSSVFDNSGIKNISFIIELDIHNFFGFFGKAICGSRSVIFFQKPAKLI